jgi:hypothetical protein
MNEIDYRRLATVGIIAAGLCLVILIATYWRTKRSFVKDFTEPGLVGETNAVVEVEPESSAADGQAAESEG